ncbi:hypothetical protein Moror_8559 [Moniliophthora roreri MCA 2997]|uniref:Uncharacterized protein n=1 Tax=Moniliophthora roreri (strain MCA 2997) TaxID=1381753 RepID=V2W6L2_MONRO|nr:hypothetical protein Moror_8559 [Moniliophthora roreri MCA 2997]
MSSTSLAVAFFTGWVCSTPAVHCPILITIYRHRSFYMERCNAVLFGAGTFLLYQRKGLNKNSAICFILATILLAQATISAVADTVVIVGQISRNSNIDLNACNVIIFVTLELLDLTACFILVHRCYALYNRNWKVLVLPMLIILADVGVYSAELSFYVRHPIVDTGVLVKDKKLAQFSMTIIVLKVLASSSLTLLIAGRIWSIRRRMQSLIGRGTPAVHRKYNNLIAMTLESGLMIPVSFIGMEVFVHMNDGVGASILGACIPQIMALAPLLIMAETTGYEVDIELQISRPLAVSVTTSQIVSVESSSGAKDEPSHSEPGLVDSDAKQLGYAV